MAVCKCGKWSGLWESMKGNKAFKIGNEQRVKFWKDVWYGEDPLGDKFRSLYIMSKEKNAWLAEQIQWFFFFLEWVLQEDLWIAKWRKWTIGMLKDHILRESVEDEIIWKAAASKDSISVKSCHSSYAL